MRLNTPHKELKGLCLGVAGGEISKSETVAFFEKHIEMDESVGRNNLTPGY
jgi:hypothetical protein